MELVSATVHEDTGSTKKNTGLSAICRLETKADMSVLLAVFYSSVETCSF